MSRNEHVTFSQRTRVLKVSAVVCPTCGVTAREVRWTSSARVYPPAAASPTAYLSQPKGGATHKEVAIIARQSAVDLRHHLSFLWCQRGGMWGNKYRYCSLHDIQYFVSYFDWKKFFFFLRAHHWKKHLNGCYLVWPKEACRIRIFFILRFNL